MVKLHLDTNRDPVDDLKEAVEILEEAITRRKAEDAVTSPSAAELVNEADAAIDTGFLQIKVESEATETPMITDVPEEPKDPITENELTEMFAAHAEMTGKKEQPPEPEEKKDDDSFIEIVEFDDD